MIVDHVFNNSLGCDVSRLGFGCASLGSRVSAVNGMRALNEAADAGVTWFDTAPAYGDGQSEAILGEFAKGRRDKIQIVTKVGLAPPRPGLVKRLLRSPLRIAVSTVPQLRGIVKRHRPKNRAVRLDPAAIAASLDASLQRLGTDHVDVYALHAVSEADAADPEIAAAMQTLVTAGKARAVGIASSPEAALATAGYAEVYRIAQFANNPFEPTLEASRRLAQRNIDVVTHSVFGNSGSVAQLARTIRTDNNVRALFHAAGYDAAASETAASSYLLDYALANEHATTLIVSMMSRKNLLFNLQRISAAVRVKHGELERIAEVIRGG